MPYLIHGTAQQLMHQFNKKWLLQSTDNGENEIKNDLPRTWFLGSLDQAAQHVHLWENTTHAQRYAQGAMSAQNLMFLLCDDFLFLKDNESVEEYFANQEIYSFAYIDDAQQTAGLTLIYRKDDPSTWMFALSKNNQLSSEEQQITLLTSFDPQSLIVHFDDAILPQVVDRLQNLFLEHIDNSFIHGMVEQALYADEGTIDSNYSRISHLLRTINYSQQPLLDDCVSFDRITPQQFFNQNSSIDLIMHHRVALSFNMLLECLKEDSQLSVLLAATPLVGEQNKDKCLIESILYFYEQNIHLTYSERLATEVFPEIRMGTIKHRTQIRLIPFLLKKDYSPELLQLIMSTPAYYEAVSLLVDLNLTQDIKTFFALANKREELIFLAKVKESELKKISLIFWVKGTLTSVQYDEIIQAGLRDHLLASTLIALDKTGEYSINEISRIALDPQQALFHSIIEHYRSYVTNIGALSSLGAIELQRLRASFAVLLEKKETCARFNEATLNTPQGDLLRIFLPSLVNEHPRNHREQLIDLLYDGVRMKSLPGTLNQKINMIDDPQLLQKAQLLRERLMCAIQMQQLGFDKEQVLFSTQQNTKAHNFRTIILKVEGQCQLIHRRMLEINTKKKQAQQWQAIEKEYRHELYRLAFCALNDPTYDVSLELARAQKKALAFVDPQIESWVYQALIVIANVFISALTLTIANQVKYQQTNNFWFFNHSISGDELNLLARDVKSLIKPQ